MQKVLFLIPNLGHGGAEKVLVNLVNNMDQTKFDITVMTLYDEGVNRQFLSTGIKYESCMKRSFFGVSHLLKLFTPKYLYYHFIKEDYDIVVSYLEGQTARIISGCDKINTKKICWIHRTMVSQKDTARLFRTVKEAQGCYSSFDCIVAVSDDVKAAFEYVMPANRKSIVLYNTIQSNLIIKNSKEEIEEPNLFNNEDFKICAMGSLIQVKGFERLIQVHNKLKNAGYQIHTYILGEGPDRPKLLALIKELNLEENITLLGYKENPYKYLEKCDLFLCSSFSEGFSTAVTEALILGLPVVTTDVSGMKELLGDNEYGIITENSEYGLVDGIRMLLDNHDILLKYQRKAKKRGEDFSVLKTVEAVERLFQEL